MTDAWYALQVRPRYENAVEQQLGGKGYEVFLPTFVCKRRWSDRVKTTVKPLFPGYVFCLFDPGRRLPVLITPGVNSIVGVGKSPVAVDPEEIFAIRSIVNSGLASMPCDYIKDGESVRVEYGPLEGLTGIVQRTKSADRLVVSLTLLMRSVSVEIDRSWVKRIPRPVFVEKATRPRESGVLIA